MLKAAKPLLPAARWWRNEGSERTITTAVANTKKLEAPTGSSRQDERIYGGRRAVVVAENS